MDIEYLNEFFVFSQYMNVSAAARELHLSQPTLSKHIAALEREFGCSLVTREGNSLSLTWEGRCLASGAADVVKSYNDLAEKVKAGHRKPHELRIAYDYTHTCSHVNIAVVRNKFFELHKDFEISYAGACKLTACETLANEDIDCMVVPFTPLEEDIAAGLMFARCPDYVPNRAFLSVSASGFLAGSDHATDSDLKQLRILMTSYQSLYYSALAQAFRNIGVSYSFHPSGVLSDFYELLPNEAMYVDELHSTYPSVNSVPQRKVLPVDDDRLREYTYIAYLPSRVRPELQTFLDFLAMFDDVPMGTILPADG